VLWGADFLPGSKGWRHATPHYRPGRDTAHWAATSNVGNSVLVRGTQNELCSIRYRVVGGWAGHRSMPIRSLMWCQLGCATTPDFLHFLISATLIKSVAVHYSDGTIGMPVYHEFIGKIAELLHIDNAGRVMEITHYAWATCHPALLLHLRRNRRLR